jgi:hypothetical protein
VRNAARERKCISGQSRAHSGSRHQADYHPTQHSTDSLDATGVHAMKDKIAAIRTEDFRNSFAFRR